MNLNIRSHSITHRLGMTPNNKTNNNPHDNHSVIMQGSHSEDMHENTAEKLASYNTSRLRLANSLSSGEESANLFKMLSNAFIMAMSLFGDKRKKRKVKQLKKQKLQKSSHKTPHHPSSTIRVA